MNLINPNNIDKWLFDYFEGNLSLHEKIEVENFLNKNPDYLTDFEAWGESHITPQEIVYQHTNTLLKKSILDKRAIAYLFAACLIGAGLLFYINSTSISKGNFASNTIIKDIPNKGIYTPLQNTLHQYSLHENNTKDELIVIEEDNVDDVILMNDLNTSLIKNDVLDKENYISSASNLNRTIPVNNSTSNTVRHAPYTSMEVNGVNMSIVAREVNVKNIPRILWKEISRKYLYEAEKIKVHREFKPMSDLLADNKTNTIRYNATSYKSYRNESMAKNLSRLFSRELALTVFNNRIMLKDNLMSLSANQSLTGSYKTPRVQMGYMQPFEPNQTFGSYLSVDGGYKKHGIGLVANYNQSFIERKYKAGLIYSYQFEIAGIKLRPSLSGKYASSKGYLFNAADPFDAIEQNWTQHIMVDAGIMLETPAFYFGAQTNNAQVFGTQQDIAKSVFGNRSYTLVLGTDYRQTFQQNLIVSPQLYLDLFEHDKRKITFSTTANFNGLIAGVGASTNKDVNVAIGAQVQNFRFIYHAKGNVENIKSADYNSIVHEVGLQFMLSRKNKGYLLYD